MKKQLTAFLIGILTAISIASTTIAINTVKPAKPKEVLVESFSNQADSKKVKTCILDRIKQGWQFKSCAGAHDGSYNSTWIVVFEKY